MSGMRTALGDQAFANDLLAVNVGLSEQHITNLWVDNILPRDSTEVIAGGTTIGLTSINTTITSGGLSLLPDGLRDGMVKVITKSSNMSSQLSTTAISLGQISDCAIVGTKVYVVGNFSAIEIGLDTATPSAIPNTLGCAIFDTIAGSWSAMESGLAAAGTATRIVLNPTLPDIMYVCGTFVGNGSGSVICNGIMRYSISGNSFSAVGSGCAAGGQVQCVLVDQITGAGNNFWIGGLFATFNAIGTINIAYWNGATAVTLTATGCGAVVNDILYYDRSASPAYQIVAVGDFLLAGGVANTIRVAVWNGAAWSALGTGANAIVKSAVMKYTPTLGPEVLYITGTFGVVNGTTAALKLAKYTAGGTWAALGIGANTGTSQQISILNDGKIIVTGNMYNYIVSRTEAGTAIIPTQSCYMYAIYDPTADRWYSGSSPQFAITGLVTNRRSLQQTSDGSFYLCMGLAPYILKVTPSELLNIRTTGTRTTSKFLGNISNASTIGTVPCRSPGAIFLTDAGQSYTLQWNSTLQKWIIINSSIPSVVTAVANTIPSVQYQYNLTV